MKIVIASDIHGAARWCERLMHVIDRESPDRVILLGDLLYHGPRNDLPKDYAPKQVIAMLNQVAPQVLAVRGNCEAEVDQMVLDFSCMETSCTVFMGDGDGGGSGDVSDASPGIRELYCTHGHVFGAGMHNSVDRMPPLGHGAALVYGHTHIKVNEESQRHPGVWLFNPGSVGIPKDGTHSCGIFEDGRFTHVML